MCIRDSTGSEKASVGSELLVVGLSHDTAIIGVNAHHALVYDLNPEQRQAFQQQRDRLVWIEPCVARHHDAFSNPVREADEEFGRRAALNDAGGGVETLRNTNELFDLTSIARVPSDDERAGLVNLQPRAVNPRELVAEAAPRLEGAPLETVITLFAGRNLTGGCQHSRRGPGRALRGRGI